MEAPRKPARWHSAGGGLIEFARIHVVGTSGSGKSVLAAELARRLGVEHIQLDALYWGPNWMPADSATFIARAEQAVAQNEWVIDGSHRAALPTVWQRAELIVWLDYPLRTVLWRVVRRTARRIMMREQLWHGNREGLARAFSRRSPIGWALRTNRRLKREVPPRLAADVDRQLVRLRSPREAARWLAAVAPRQDADIRHQSSSSSGSS